jgi:hypothetical protein
MQAAAVPCLTRRWICLAACVGCHAGPPRVWCVEYSGCVCVCVSGMVGRSRSVESVCACVRACVPRSSCVSSVCAHLHSLLIEDPETSSAALRLPVKQGVNTLACGTHKALMLLRKRSDHRVHRGWRSETSLPCHAMTDSCTLAIDSRSCWLSTANCAAFECHKRVSVTHRWPDELSCTMAQHQQLATHPAHHP